MRPALILLRLFLFVAILGSAACIKVSDLQVDLTPTPRPPDRADCAEIFDSAFRSETERAWFVENCSAWSRATLGVVQAAPPTAPVAPPAPPAAPTAVPSPQTQARPGEDPRCGQMRGQPYANATDRAWFLANCLASPNAPASYDPGPERFNCDEIRGTNYRSANERNWYLQNCQAAR
jgi:hypothetical protein